MPATIPQIPTTKTSTKATDQFEGYDSTASAGSRSFNCTRDTLFSPAAGDVISATVNGIGVTSTPVMAFVNSTASTAGVQAQWSPHTRWTGHAWNTVADEQHDWIAEVQTTGGNPSTSKWTMSYQRAGGGYSARVAFDSQNNFNFTGVAAFSGSTNLNITGLSTTGYTSLSITNNPGGNVTLYSFGATYTTSGRFVAVGSCLDGTGSGGLNIAASNVAGVLGFYTGGNNLRLTVSAAGLFTFWDGANMVLGTSTGTQWGTATGQKQAWWGATPVVQQVFATGAGKTVDNVITLLQTLGLCKQS
jgi:hypothetical protein